MAKLTTEDLEALAKFVYGLSTLCHQTGVRVSGFLTPPSEGATPSIEMNEQGGVTLRFDS